MFHRTGGNMLGAGSAETTLGDYLARKTRHDAFTQVAKEKKLVAEETPTPKLSFEKWWDSAPYYTDPKSAAADAWIAAQENV